MVVGPSGLEPPTLRLSVVRSSQLSYGPVSTSAEGFVPSKLNNELLKSGAPADQDVTVALVSSATIMLLLLGSNYKICKQIFELVAQRRSP